MQGNKRKFAEVEREIADSLARAHALFQQMSAQASDASMGCVGKAERLCVEMQAKGKEMRAIARMQAKHLRSAKRAEATVQGSRAP